MDRKQKRIIKQLQAMAPADQLKTIQASAIEGVNYDFTMDSFLTGARISGTGGTNNLYKSYSAQVVETYRKYDGESDFGNSQTKSIVDARAAFIGGEGLSVALDDEAKKGHVDFFKAVIKFNKLTSIKMMDIVKTTEMAGYAIAAVVSTDKRHKLLPLLIIRGNSKGGTYYSPILREEDNPLSIKGFHKDDGKEKVTVPIRDSVYIRTGGYGDYTSPPTTKVGAVLTNCENYDRALFDIRELNYRCARITPDFKTTKSGEAAAIKKQLEAAKWEIGQARIGSAEFSFKTPGSGAHNNLKDECVTQLKTISGTTAVPVHWMGWVDQLSNRATAQELYAMIYNGTLAERSSIEAAMYEVLLLMQQKYIDDGGELIQEVYTDFEVRLPMIDFGKFESMVKAYSLLYTDEIITEETYRNIVPGVDPIKEKEMLEAKRAKAAEEDRRLVDKSDLSDETNIDENEEEEEVDE